jgi:hypothetical protein
MLGLVSSANGARLNVAELAGSAAGGTLLVYSILTGKSGKHFLPGQRPILAAIVCVLFSGLIFISVATDLEVGEHAMSIASATALVTLLLLVASDYIERRKFRGSASWPITQATIEMADVRILGGGRSRQIVADLGYSYTVNGSYYAGHVVRPFRKEEQARSFAKKVVGKTLRVRFEPTKFELSEIAE